MEPLDGLPDLGVGSFVLEKSAIGIYDDVSGGLDSVTIGKLTKKEAHWRAISAELDGSIAGTSEIVCNDAPCRSHSMAIANSMPSKRAMIIPSIGLSCCGIRLRLALKRSRCNPNLVREIRKKESR
jgi:hypothetical protein